jgi:hypothetical protein
MVIAGSDKGFKQGMRLERPGFELGVKLTSQKPGMILDFYDFDQIMVWILPRDDETGLGQAFLVIGVEFKTVAVALIDIGFFVSVLG